MGKELEEASRTEHAAGRALVGPHRDDLVISLREHPAHQMASQGEKSSILLALKFGELDIVKKKGTRKPTVLLDDLGTTLDCERKARLLSWLKNDAHQAIITTSDEGLACALEADGAAIFRKKIEPENDGFSIAHWRPA